LLASKTTRKDGGDVKEEEEGLKKREEAWARGRQTQ